MKSILPTQLTVTDFVLIVVVILGLLVGAKKGLSVMFSKLLALFAIIFIVFYYYVTVSAWISTNSSLPLKTTQLIVFIIFSIVAWIVVNLILSLLGKIMEIKFSEGVNRFGGFLLGGLWAYVLAGFILYILLTFKIPIFNTNWVSSSFFAPPAVQIPLVTYQFFFHQLPPAPAL